MYKKTEDLLKKFEQEHEIYVEARDQKSVLGSYCKDAQED